MILILSTQTEQFSNMAEIMLCADKIPYFRLNLDLESVKNTVINCYNNDIEINQFGNKLCLSEVKFVWLKVRKLIVSHKEEKVFGGFSDEVNFKLWRDEWNITIMQIISFLEKSNVKWFDTPISLSNAGLKNQQIKSAKEITLSIPKTLISNDKYLIADFLNSNKENIVKLSTQPVFFFEDDIYFVYTNKITIGDLNDFDNCVNSPMIFQEYIEKQYEVRYTFVNSKHFVCKIESQISEKSKIDWRRYDIKNTPYIEIEPPEEIYDKVNLYMKCLQLNYGTLDFIVDNDNKWWFLEINPVGQYGWIEQLTGMPITQAIVDYIKWKIY
jgi:glutathione synthase/RimK-type ligase-like ATP-grasp enzyme